MRCPSSRPLRWALVIAVAAALRLAFFTGLSLGDDVFYASEAAALANGGGWPPPQLHWHTRLGLILPTGSAVATLGWAPPVFVWLPFAASLFGVWLAYRVAADTIGPDAAWIAALFQATFPLELIYSTHLFPDVVVGTLSALSIWLWIHALRTDRAALYAAAGAAFGAGYLCRETVLFEGPIYLALWAYFGRLKRPRMLWVAVVPLVVLGVESVVYRLATGDFLFRWAAMAKQQADPTNLALINASATGGGFWTDPLLMVLTSHELGAYYLVGLPIAVAALWRGSAVRPLACWVLVGFAWLFYGTTVPTAWVPLQRDPRYAASLTIPIVVLIAGACMRLEPRTRWAAAALLGASGMAAASLDQGNAVLAAHERFASSAFARDAAVEPFEYFGARWTIGLQSPPAFACASDQGRRSVTDLMPSLPGTTLASMAERRYFVFSPDRRPDLMSGLGSDGWHVVHEIEGRGSIGRNLVGRILRRVPSQEQRAERLLKPRGLVIMERAGS